tara:strand:+ start:438 stop:632 length:195 start_codon:yes stop_codon:yes gene_type:complete
MNLKLLEIDLIWHKEIQLKDLRCLVLKELNKYGSPLRWAITSVSTNELDDTSREIRVEAIVMTG